MIIKKFNQFIKESNDVMSREDIDDQFLRLVEVLDCEIAQSPLFLSYKQHGYVSGKYFGTDYSEIVDVLKITYRQGSENEVYSELMNVISRIERMYPVDIEITEILHGYSIVIKKRDKTLQEHYDYINSINESFGSIDIKSYLRKVFERISKASKEHKYKILMYALTTLLLTTKPENILSVVNSDQTIKTELSNSPNLKRILDEKLKFQFSNPTSLSVSQKGCDQIKLEESKPAQSGDPALSAYTIGDGKITIGWGHAEPIKKSKFKVGDKITKEQAQELFNKDITETTNGVRRIFSEWKKEGIDRKITQDMFDALSSISFNTGISGLRKSQVIQEIKKGNYKKAGELIKLTNVKSKFGGLAKRRELESKLFLTFLRSTSGDKA